MPKLLKLRRGTTSQHSSFTGAEGEVTVDTDKETLVVHDGSTAGGHALAAEDMANVSSSAIAGRLGTDSIAVGKIAAGTLPSDVKVTDSNVSGNLTIESADIVNGTIVNADINASAQISLSKLETITSNRIVGNDSGNAVPKELTAAEVRSIINVEDGATADQTKSDIDALNINADQLDGQDGSYYRNASNLNAGTIPDARFPATLPAISGANLTGITSFVSGMIIMYNSASAPSGWYLCDGNNGTPDLRDRFIVGAGNSYSLNATGGSNTATDTVSISGSDTVNISISGNTSTFDATKTFGFQQAGSNATVGHNHSFSGSGSDTVNISGSDTVSVDTRSPYYALTFIMKA